MSSFTCSIIVNQTNDVTNVGYLIIHIDVTTDTTITKEDMKSVSMVEIPASTNHTSNLPICTNNNLHITTTLLRTAKILIKDTTGHYQVVCALVDPKSHVSFISKDSIYISHPKGHYQVGRAWVDPGSQVSFISEAPICVFS